MTTTKLVTAEYGDEVQFESMDEEQVYVKHQGLLGYGDLQATDAEDDTYTYAFGLSEVLVVEDHPTPSALIVAFRGLVTGRNYCHDCAYDMQVSSPRMNELMARRGKDFAERVYHASVFEVLLLMGDEALVTPATEASGRCSACGQHL